MQCCYRPLWHPPGCFNERGSYVKAKLNSVLPTLAKPYLKTLASSNWFSPAGDNSKKSPCKLPSAHLVVKPHIKSSKNLFKASNLPLML